MNSQQWQQIDSMTGAILQLALDGGSLGSASVVSGSSSAVERQLPKLDVAGSIPVSRSKLSQYFQSFTPTTKLSPISVVCSVVFRML
jgi:hypothetical protein